MAARHQSYLKGYASPSMTANILRKRELRAKGSVDAASKCPLVGRPVPLAGKRSSEDGGVGDALGDQDKRPAVVTGSRQHTAQGCGT